MREREREILSERKSEREEARRGCMIFCVNEQILWKRKKGNIV